MKKDQPKIVRRVFDTYIAVIENSVGSYLFKNLYADVNGEKKDVLKDGWLSCAFFVSAILHMFGFIDSIHGTVESTVKDLKKNGWKKIAQPKIGSVIVWGPGKTANGHSHTGFYIGKSQAISNDSWKKHPVEHDWKYGGKRKVKELLWKSEIKQVIEK